MLPRLSPLLPHDVSVIPLASPAEYELRWRHKSAAASVAAFGNGGSGRLNSDSVFGDSDSVSDFAAVALKAKENEANWLAHENVSLEDLKDTCSMFFKKLFYLIY